MFNQVIQGDCLIKLKELEDNSVDSIVTDPPYELGFMGKSWDNTGIANNVEMWKECLRVLKPGGHLLAFSGTRTYHRMASAIEDAGFEVRDMIEWVYGSGFPKSRNIGLDVDKRNGVTKNRGKAFVVAGQSGQRDKDTGGDLVPGSNTMGAYIAQNEWSGWGTALKPAHEPICMARKPLSEKTVAENCLKWGTGGINIDESRVGADKIEINGGGKKWRKNGKEIEYAEPINEERTGRFPANLIHDNSEEVRDTMMQDYQDPSRFFKSIIYQAKASKSERNKGCEDMDNNKPMYESHRPNYENTKGIETPFAGTGRTGNLNQNNHPTVKPIALMEYLIKMVTPKGGTVLDPFAGSGSTLVAAKQNGFQYIGIEMTEEYIPIIEARLK